MALCAALLASAAATAWTQVSSSGPYHLVKKIVLGGEGGWDYIAADPLTHHVFIGRGTYVMVVNPDGTLVAKMDVGKDNEAHDVQFAPELHRAFTSNGGGASVTIFDPNTFQVISEVKVPGRDTDAILYEPSLKRLFTFNGGKGNNDATAIDAIKGVVVGSIPLGGKPESAQTDGQGHVWVNMEESSTLEEFDARTLQVLHTWPLAPCANPSGQAIDRADGLLIIGCRNGLMEFWDYKNNKTVGSVPIGQGVDANRFDPETKLAFASTGDGHITIAKVDGADNKFTVVQTLDTMPGARTMTIDTANHNIYTVTTELGPAPPATPANPHPRPKRLPGTFTLLIYGR
jgi:DNA-binding beta-propeller fold protein YncE